MKKLFLWERLNFQRRILKGLLADSRYEILAVVTQPDRKVGRKKRDSNDPGEAGSFGTSTTGSSAGEIIG